MNEARTVFLDIQASPGLARVFDSFAFLSVAVSTTVDSASASGSSTILALLLTLVMSLSVHAFLAAREIYTHFLLCWNFACHPGVCQNLFDSRALSRVKRHHPLKEVLELS